MLVEDHDMASLKVIFQNTSIYGQQTCVCTMQNAECIVSDMRMLHLLQ